MRAVPPCLTDIERSLAVASWAGSSCRISIRWFTHAFEQLPILKYTAEAFQSANAVLATLEDLIYGLLFLLRSQHFPSFPLAPAGPLIGTHDTVWLFAIDDLVLEVFWPLFEIDQGIDGSELLS